MYSDERVISRRPSFLPRYSGVRPTISPATNTAMTASTSIPYSPEPTPPGATSPSIMLTIATPPPSGVKLSCMEFTDPVEVSVVASANSADSGPPNRTSLPSIAAPASWVAVPPARASNQLSSATETVASAAMTPRIA